MTPCSIALILGSARGGTVTVVGVRGERRRGHPIRRLLVAGAIALLAGYLFLQSPSLWFVRLAPSRVPNGEPSAERVLVVAPHPDDDILGVGSSIASFRERGIPVLVAFLTSGDANVAGQRLVTMNPFLFSSEFRAIGTRRQKEAVIALGRLGVDPSHAVFLNYPDRGLAELSGTHWSSDIPYRSPYTARSSKYSSAALNPRAAYSGEVLLGDIVEILRAYRPTIVYLPHPLDAHEDHRAGYAFVHRAVDAWRDQDQDAAPPSLRCYLVHSYAGVWPVRSRISEVLPMEPLASFLARGTWYSTPLADNVILAKYRALRAHASQWWTGGKFLGAFVCSNELFMVEDS